MQRISPLLVLCVAMATGPAFAQEPPTAGAKPRALLGAPSLEIPAPPVASYLPPLIQQGVPAEQPKNDAAPKQDAGAAQPKNGGEAKADPPAGPLSSFLPPLSSRPDTGDTLLSLGAWFTRNTGSIAMTGEYQGMTSSPFWVIDGLYSNGYHTLGLYGNQTDNDTNQAGFRYLLANAFVDLDYQRFIHRLGHRSLDNFTASTPITDKTNFPANSIVLGKDQSFGQDYAIRVEELRSSTGWRINDNLRARVDFWQMRKFGERQENAVAHCFVASAGGSRNCHVLSQSQHIDWTTTEVTPRLEFKLGPLTVEYLRPMRQFIQDDQMIFRNYNNGSLTKPSSSGGMIWGDYPYAIVPQTLTQIDQLKGSLDLGPTRQLYAFGYVGNTHNQDRDVQRYFNGGDVRYTDWTLPRTSITVYGRTHNQSGTRPTTLNPSELQFFTPEKANAEIRTPIEYHRDTTGIKGNWRPDFNLPAFRDLTFTGGYEYDYLGRHNAIWQTPFLSSPGLPAGSQEVGIYSQDNTKTHTLFAGVRKPWGFTFDTFVRYKVQLVDNVLFGFRELSNVLNTSLPQERHIVEFGGGWYPAGNFSIMLDQSIDLGRTYHDNTAQADGNVIDLRDESYATTLTILYSPTRKVSVVASVSVYSNWINQTMFLGDDYIDPEDPIPPKNVKIPLAIQPTFYAGRSQLFDFNLIYRLSDNARLLMGYQFVHGSNYFNMTSDPTFAYSPTLSTSEPAGPITFTDLGKYSLTRVDTNKVTAGIAWRVRPNAVVNVYYNLFSYFDETNSSNTGVAHQVNASLSCIW